MTLPIATRIVVGAAALGLAIADWFNHAQYLIYAGYAILIIGMPAPEFFYYRWRRSRDEELAALVRGRR